jgi:hypothetical protein
LAVSIAAPLGMLTTFWRLVKHTGRFSYPLANNTKARREAQAAWRAEESVDGRPSLHKAFSAMGRLQERLQA